MREVPTLQVFRRGLTRTLKGYAETSGLLSKLKFDINGDDFREGLTAVISVKVAEPQFEGQTKTKLGNSEISISVDQAVSEMLKNYLDREPKRCQDNCQQSDIGSHSKACSQKSQRNGAEEKCPYRRRLAWQTK